MGQLRETFKKARADRKFKWVVLKYKKANSQLAQLEKSYCQSISAHIIRLLSFRCPLHSGILFPGKTSLLNVFGVAILKIG